jgi:hypothetical protein
MGPLDTTVRAANVLLAAGVSDAEGLRRWAAERTLSSLMGQRNVGRKTIAEIATLVSDCGGSFIAEDKAAPAPYRPRRTLPSEIAARQRRADVVAHRKAGKTFAQIGREMGLSGHRVFQLFAVAKRRQEAGLD